MSSSSEWVHCNKCFRTPPCSNGIPFYFSNCGHILCRKCIADSGNQMRNACPHCNKSCSVVEINRNLKPEIQQFFRNPTDLAAQFMAQLKRVLEFQASNRVRLLKHVNDKNSKMQKYIECTQIEIKRRAEQEKKALEDRKNLMLEVEKCKQQIEKLNVKLVAREKELERLGNHHPTNSRASSDSGFSSAMDMSFQEFVTSTPLQGPSPSERRQRSTERHRAPDIFSESGNKLSPIAQDPLSTPALLGIKKKSNNRRTSSASGRTGDFNFGHDVDMGGF